ncbi:chemotaxis protein CheA [Parasulfitobacter algicola]|uniref:Chemotaxis protein CheA n=1 Tax=Parasulfitobacter algicola TaxID=2614809 RepID=A0ABX2IYD1_9RHOB|nr:chemotaxis protein CheA [Sulfitobacter algicola]NSX55483.1 chemotaxis protein CheA [Sulfitobacter algicola]
MTSTDPMAEIRASFFIECEELLESLQDGLEALGSGDSDPETINIVFRAVHSIKGGAGAFGLDQLVEFAHSYETVLDGVRSGETEITPDLMRLLFQSGDILSDLVRLSRDDEPIEKSLTEATYAALKEVAGSSDEEEPEADIDFQPMGLAFDFADLAEEKNAFIITFKPEAELFTSGNEPLHLFRTLAELGNITVTCDASALPIIEDMDIAQGYLSWTLRLETDAEKTAVQEVFEFVEGLCDLKIEDDIDLPALPDLAPLEPVAETVSEAIVPLSATAPSAPAEAKTAAAPKPTVRVDLERVDRLVNLVGELVINQAMLSQSISDTGIPGSSEIATGLEEFMRLTRDIQDSVMMIRAQPIKSLFQRMSRIVRESSAAIGKDVKFVTEGENTEIDKTVIERLSDPLTHMIRNAVDHGLESNADRVAAGKPEQGIVKLSAIHRSGRVIIEISDDGAGINRPKVQQIAIEKGLIAKDTQLSDAETDNLLFAAGFSTATEVSNLSGRGVGMDVVRSAIQSLGGRISIASTPGSGTTFTISLPLTLAVMDGMVINVADQAMVVPLNSIAETLALTQNDIEQLGPNKHLVRNRDTFVPLLDLGVELGYRHALPSYEGAVVLLISQEDGSRAALVVDTIQDQRQVVIKGLEESYGRVPGVAAATILGDGQIALILDPTDIISNASLGAAPDDAPFAIAG